MPCPEVQGTSPPVIPKLESTTAMHSVAAALTERQHAVVRGSLLYMMHDTFATCACLVSEQP